MKITWLGQAGLLFETQDLKIIVDPYLSDSVGKINPQNYRRTPADEKFLAIKPDALVFTHNHLDHYDPETARHYLESGKNILVLSPSSVWDEVRKSGGGHNYVIFNRHTEWTLGGVKFTAVKAEHSDKHAIGVILEDLSCGKKYYITGDTLYNTGIFCDIPKDIHALFLPINGVGNNMNLADASRFAEKIGARYTVPIHWGMFDELDPGKFECNNKIIPQIYKEITL